MDAGRLLFLMPLLPLCGFLLIGLAGSRAPRRVVGPLACAGPALAFAIAVLGFLQVLPAGSPALRQGPYPWMQVGTVEVPFGFALDRLSAVLSLVVTGVGSLIHVYSLGYMRGDPGYRRFFACLNLFTAAMLVLVLADNLVFLFLGWEGVGLSSYLLIGFWFEDPANAAAGRKAFVVNRIGDFAFLLGIFLAFGHFQSFRLEDLNRAQALEQVLAASPGALSAIALLLFAGATGKSAQVPLYVWLPDAMAGPTPVSALIHAATMVTSGVYLVARLFPLFAAAPGALEVVAAIGGLTALLAALIAITQFDIKRVLAYSTVSQLGTMFVAAGAGLWGAAIFHLWTHAFFKALLFLGAGAVIHSLHHEQDLRRMGGLRRTLPRTCALFLVGALAIAGFPFFSGFFSKEEILAGLAERAFGPEGGPGWVVLWLATTLTAVLTSFYIFRLVALAFFGEERWRRDPASHGSPRAEVHEAPGVMMGPLWALALLSLAGGWVDLPGFLGGSRHPHSPGLGRLVLLAGLGAFLLGLAAAYVLYLRAPEARVRLIARRPLLRGLLRLSARKLFVDELYALLLLRPFRALTSTLYYLVDRVLIDTLLVEGAGGLVRASGSVLRRIQSGRVPAYAAWFMAGVVAVLWAVLHAAGGAR